MLQHYLGSETTVPEIVTYLKQTLGPERFDQVTCNVLDT